MKDKKFFLNIIKSIRKKFRYRIELYLLKIEKRLKVKKYFDNSII